MPKKSMTKKRTTQKNSTAVTDKRLLQNIKQNICIGEELFYNELAEKCGLKIGTGNQRIGQLNRLRRFMDLELPEGKRKYIVNDIYDKPLSAAISDYRSDAVYPRYIKVAMLSHFLRYGIKEDTMFQKEWWAALHMVNNYYTIYEKLKFRQYLYSATPTMDKRNVDFFFKTGYQRLHSLFINSLESMKDKNYITYINHYVIVRQPETDFRQATEEEEHLINKERKKVLKDMGIKSYSDLVIKYSYLEDEFNSNVNDILYMKYHMSGIFRNFEITLNMSLEKAQEMVDNDKDIFTSDIAGCFKRNIQNELGNIYSKYRQEVIVSDEDAELIELFDGGESLRQDLETVYIGNNPNRKKKIENFVTNQKYLLDRLMTVSPEDDVRDIPNIEMSIGRPAK